ncbi:MAG: DNA repair protein RecO [Ignavibacteriales bacterium]|nr:DNA repair protein RecO [Ignavibacteriales bacterium]
MITKTAAIVLKSMKFRDTSKIVTFYSRTFGKLKAVAKGARETKSKFGAALEPMSLVSLVLYKKPNKDLHLISQCDILDQYKNVHVAMERMSVGLAMVELLERVTHDEEENSALFSLVVDCLGVLDKSDKNFQSILLAFEVQMASRLGFGPSLETCLSCGTTLGRFDRKAVGVFKIPQGAVVCPECLQLPPLPGGRMSIEGRKSSMEVFRVLRSFQEKRLELIPSIEYDDATGNEIDETLRLYLRHHFEDLKPLKSTEVFQKLFEEVKGG